MPVPLDVFKSPWLDGKLCRFEITIHGIGPRPHLERIGVKLTRLFKKQANYVGVPIEGPYKPEHYRY